MGRYYIAALAFGFVLATSFQWCFVDAKLSFMKVQNGTENQEVILKANAYELFDTKNTVNFEVESPYIPVIDIFASELLEGFHICDESTYPISGGLSFNKSLVLPTGEKISTTRWAARFTNANVYRSRCSQAGLQDPKWLIFGKSMAKRAQDLGASAMIYYYQPGGSELPSEVDAKKTPPNADRVARMVDGTHITIPCVIFDYTEENFSTLFDPELVVQQIWLKSASILDTDTNWRDVHSVFGYFMIGNCCFLVWRCYLLYIAAIGLMNQRRSTMENGDGDEASKRIVTIRYLILVPELTKCLVGVWVDLDPGNIQNFPGNNYILSSFCNSFTTLIGNFSDIMMCLYCYEVYNLFKCTAKMRKNTSIFEKYKFIIPCVVGLAFVLVVIRISNFYDTFLGTAIITPARTILSFFGLLLTYIIVGIYLNCLSCRASKLISLVTSEVKKKDRDSTVFKIITMIGYMRKTSFGLFLYFVFFFLLVIGFGVANDVEYAILLWVLSLSNIASSHYQILAAVFMIPKKKEADKKKVLSTVKVAAKAGSSTSASSTVDASTFKSTSAAVYASTVVKV